MDPLGTVMVSPSSARSAECLDRSLTSTM
jgi:hypothetical protein